MDLTASSGAARPPAAVPEEARGRRRSTREPGGARSAGSWPWSLDQTLHTKACMLEPGPRESSQRSRSAVNGILSPTTGRDTNTRHRHGEPYQPTTTHRPRTPAPPWTARTGESAPRTGRPRSGASRPGPHLGAPTSEVTATSRRAESGTGRHTPAITGTPEGPSLPARTLGDHIEQTRPSRWEQRGTQPWTRSRYAPSRGASSHGNAYNRRGEEVMATQGEFQRFLNRIQRGLNLRVDSTPTVVLSGSAWRSPWNPSGEPPGRPTRRSHGCSTSTPRTTS